MVLGRGTRWLILAVIIFLSHIIINATLTLLNGPVSFFLYTKGSDIRK